MKLYKKWTICTLLCIFLCIIFLIVSVVVIDPFLQFHMPWVSLEVPFNRETQAYINPGLAKNYEYDSLLIGSSVSENFFASDVDALFDCKTLKLPYAGGSSKNYEYIMDVAFKNHDLQYVFLSLDMFALYLDYTVPNNNPVPLYLYNDNLFEKTNYVLNKDIMTRVFNMLISNNRQDIEDSLDKAYNWHNSQRYSQERVLEQYNRMEQSTKILPSDFYYKNIDGSFENISPYILDHPETTFVVFYPPYSVIQYDAYQREGSLDAFLSGMQYSMEKLLSFDNVELYSFANCTEIITNLDFYREMMHFSQDINKYMLEEIAKKNYRITDENYKKETEKLRAFIADYDYNRYFE